MTLSTTEPPGRRFDRLEAALRRPRVRAGLYVVMCAALAAGLYFPGLGDDALGGDEAQYALVVQNIKRSGEWIDVSPYPPTPYLQKPPLYLWLTAATYDLFDPSAAANGANETAYRFWSAVFGVACVALTCALAAAMLSPEVGLLAALLLLTNRHFLLTHGARSATFDTALTFFVLSCVGLYWLVACRRMRAGPPSWRPWLGWAGIGVAAGLASLAKPLAGLPVLGLLAVHAIALDRQSPWRLRLGGPALALLLAAAWASPWYLAQWSRYGDVFVREMFQKNLVQRATEGVHDRHIAPWNYYAEQLTDSSPAFTAAVPAMVFAVVACVAGQRRREYGLIALVSVGWVVLFSLSSSKLAHYLYPVYPLIAVAIADLAAWLVRWVSQRRRRRPGDVAAGGPGLMTACYLGALVLVGWHWCRLAYRTIPDQRAPYVPWDIYRTFAPAAADGRAQVVFFGWPEAQVEWRNQVGLKARDCYYLEQIRRPPGGDAGSVKWVNDPAELAGLLAPRRPTVLLTSGLVNAAALPDGLDLPGHRDVRFTYEHAGYTLAALDLAPLLDTRLVPGDPSSADHPYLRLVDGDPTFEGTLRVGAKRPLPEDVRIAATVELATETQSRSIRCAVKVRGGGDAVAPIAGGRIVVAARILRDRWPTGASPSEEQTLAFQLRSNDPAHPAEVIRGRVVEVRLTVLPHVPFERRLPQ